MISSNTAKFRENDGRGLIIVTALEFLSCSRGNVWDSKTADADFR